MPKGATLCWHGAALHGSPANRSDRWRRAWAVHFVAEGTTKGGPLTVSLPVITFLVQTLQGLLNRWRSKLRAQELRKVLRQLDGIDIHSYINEIMHMIVKMICLARYGDGPHAEGAALAGPIFTSSNVLVAPRPAKL